MRHHFAAEQWVPYNRERVFAFFADPANLPPLMPGWQRTRTEKLELVTPPEGGSSQGAVAGKGSLITISFRPVPLVPFRLAWEAYIAEFAWNEFFCDEQRRGPFHYFRHCHRVRGEVRGAVSGTVVRDEVEYAFPLGPLGDVANALGGRMQIRALFAHRQKTLLKLLGQAHP